MKTIKSTVRHNLNKTTVLLFTTFFATFFASSVFAADFRNDTSTAFLSILFGGVTDSYGSVIQGQKSLMGTIFQYFNGFVATVGASLIFYITCVSVMHSAHSGKPLGDKWHTMFLPMRVAAGAGMLLPNAYGYNFAQVITMWFILTGVNGADTVWDSVVNRLHMGGQTAITGGSAQGKEDPEYINPSTGLSEPGGKFNVITYLAPAIKFAVCVGSYVTAPTLNPGSAAPTKACQGQYPTCDVIPVALSCIPSDCTGTNTTIVPSDARVQKACGAINFSISNMELKDDIRTNYIKGILGVISTTANDARKFFPDYIYYDPTSGTYDISNISSDQLLDFRTKIQSITDPAIATMSLINSAVLDQRIAESTKTLPQYEAIAKDIGWISAGSTYYGIIKSGGQGKNYSSIEYYVGDTLSSTTGINQQLAADIAKQVASLRAQLGTATSAGSANPAVVSPRVEVSYNDPWITALGVGIPLFIQFIIHSVLDTSKMLGYPEQLDVTNVKSIREAIAIDPLGGIADTGSAITKWCERIFFSVMTLMLLAAATSAIAPLLPYFNLASGILMAAITIGMIAAFIGLIFYPIGLMMNVYIPLIPFMIYMTGVIGWLLLCIEAMAAGPIVALGLMHPAGDEILGSAEHGLKLLLNLMLRPVLMVTGLIAGVVVVRLVLLFFSFSMSLILRQDTAVSLIPVKSLGAVGTITFVYVGLLTVLIQKSFSLINEIPNKVMTWIGATGSSVSGEQELLQKGEGQVKEGGKMPTDIGTKGASGAIAGYKAFRAISSSGAKKPPPKSSPTDAELGP